MLHDYVSCYCYGSVPWISKSRGRLLINHKRSVAEHILSGRVIKQVKDGSSLLV